MWDQICLVGELPKPTVVKLHLSELIQCDTAEGSWQGDVFGTPWCRDIK